MGTPVVALCGKVWVPSRAPEKFPVCPECKEIWESMQARARATATGPSSDARRPRPRTPPSHPTARTHSGLAGARGLGHGAARCAPGRPRR